MIKHQLKLDIVNAQKRIENLGSDNPNRRTLLKEIRDIWKIILSTNFQYIPREVESNLVGPNKQFHTIMDFGEAVKKDLRRQAAIDLLFSKSDKKELVLRKGWEIKLEEHNKRLSQVVELVQLLTEMTLDGIGE